VYQWVLPQVVTSVPLLEQKREAGVQDAELAVGVVMPPLDGYLTEGLPLELSTAVTL
jgi:hypothetical protein